MNTPQKEWWEVFFHGIALDLWRQCVTDEQTQSEATFLQKALQISSGAEILDAPCGGGRLALELARRGYRMTGVDLADEFIREAQTKATECSLPIAWKQADMRNLDWPNAFDGAFCFGNSFGYFQDDGNVAFLNSIARSLKPRARFILETGTVAESILPRFKEEASYEIGNIHFELKNRYEPTQGRLYTEYTFVRDGKTEKRAGFHRVYSCSEIHRLLRETGLDGIESYGSLDFEPFKLGSPRLLVVASK